MPVRQGNMVKILRTYTQANWNTIGQFFELFNTFVTFTLERIL